MKKLFTIIAMASAIFTANTAFASTAETEAQGSDNASTTERVSAHSTDEYEVYFKAGREVCVIVVGDTDTDLDLYVYDENGNLIDKDIDESDLCVCSWTPKWSGEFTIQVKNLGSVYNEYVISVAQ